MRILKKNAIEILKNKRPSEQMLISGKMCVDILLNLIEKQDKIINEMAKYIDDTQMECNVYYKDKEEVIEYFIKKVGE